MVTIHDVAKRAGVGVGTVSRVINGSESVSDRTRAKVQAVIDELGYRPSRVARQLSTGTNDTIGVVVPSVTSPSVVVRLRGIVDVIGDADREIVLFDVLKPEQRDVRYRELIEGQRVAGALIISLPPTDVERDALRARSQPLVLIDATADGIPSVSIDDVAGGRMATQHLVELGHQKIAFVGDRVTEGFGFVASPRRQAGYVAALDAAGVEVRTDYVVAGPHGRNEAHQLTQQLLALDDPPTGIVAASDLQAFGVMEAVRQAGLRVPDDVSVVGFDDIETAPYLDLTTIRQPLYETGTMGAEMLLRCLAGDPNVEPVILPLELVARASSGPPLR